MKTSLSTPQIKSIEAKILNISRTTGRSSMETRTLFLLERAVARILLDSLLQDHLVFKGGYVALRIYQSTRFTSDIDAVIKGLSPEEAIQRIKNAVDHDMGDGAWFVWEGEDTLQTQGEYGGRRLTFRAGIGDIPAKLKNALIVNIDLGIGDPVTPGPFKTETTCTLGEGSLSWQVYPIETMLAEKIHALVVLGDNNSRSKDVYDIDLFWPQANIENLRLALEATFNFRGDRVPKSFADTIRSIDTTLLKRGWVTATLSLKERPKFESVMESLLEKIGQI
ncbi:MAG TPA: nucleotidyl transferase AbiEii/AbiGii toxin family protein [Oligoflexus sp.]|uniref:nucleotidyl transferase AbiEii/AbiGii toxin family protein n=1 Tax=Oligoflexus sp. TaxID=1971216 RepID=UPI002D7F2729|nr:nucleotidyl transferase AbiEii/AbiGii toxin family protein [Oligoflexus sp.]HET9240375.1 nucleotidyl transferase AbiEii/AbiGii toxin family protein [Oligoflexus sp.]